MSTQNDFATPVKFPVVSLDNDRWWDSLETTNGIKTYNGDLCTDFFDVHEESVLIKGNCFVNTSLYLCKTKFIVDGDLWVNGLMEITYQSLLDVHGSLFCASSIINESSCIKADEMKVNNSIIMFLDSSSLKIKNNLYVGQSIDYYNDNCNLSVGGTLFGKITKL